MKLIHSLPFIAAVLLACNSNQEIITSSEDPTPEITSAINPIEGLATTPDIFKVNAIQSDTVFLANGGSIVFDDHSFVDRNGDPVSGEVDIEWQEFHSLADIAVSGIPMKYDSSGTDYDLVSGGMFTINAKQNGEDLQIAPGKSATVNLVSQQDTPCYNFYALDEETGDWSYQTTKNGEKVQDNQEVKPIESAVKGTILDVEVNTNGIQELEAVEVIGWKTEERLTEEKRAWLSSNHSKARLTEILDDGCYELEVKSMDGTELLKVRPYTLENALEDSRLNELELARDMDDIKEYQERLAAGKIVRSIAIQDFGTYNWDIVCKRANSTRMIANFEFPGNHKAPLISLFLISPDENAIIKYDATGDSKFSFDPNLKNCLIAILPNNELVAVGNDDFKKMVANADGKNCTFAFKRTGVQLKSATDIENHLEKLI